MLHEFFYVAPYSYAHFGLICERLLPCLLNECRKRESRNQSTVADSWIKQEGAYYALTNDEDGDIENNSIV